MRAADLLLGLHGPVRVEEQDPHCAAAVAAVVIPLGSYRQVAHAIAIQISQRRY